MKEKELKRQLERIARRVEKKDFIKKTKEIAQKYGDYKVITHSCHTEERGSFDGPDYLGNRIIIKFHDGWSMFGGEDLSITYVTEKFRASEVFSVSTSPAYSDFGTPEAKEKPGQVKVGGLYLHTYLPGQWEAQLNRIYKNGPKKDKPKVVKPEEREVEQSKLEEMAARLPIKI